MTTNRLRPMAFRFAIGSVLGAALLAGTAYGDGGAKSASHEEGVVLNRSDEKVVERIEQDVAKSPFEAGLRAELGQAYLRTGRFASATAAFTDAMALGDGSGRTALGLALANVARGNNREALGILESARGGIAASDLGLALALAGKTGHGVAILTDALRGGDNSVKVRQNLAYAYALNGSWREARIMMTQDVPGDQLNARLTKWAASGHPALYRQRVAALLGAPVRADSGQPEHLALNVTPATAQAAAEIPAVSEPIAAAELPPVEQVPVQRAPIEQAQRELASTSAPVHEFVPALSATPLAPAPVSAPVQNTRSLAAFDEFVRPVETMVKAPRAKPAPVRAPRAAPSLAVGLVEGGNHVVQLGAFSSEQNARRAWTVFVSRNPELKKSRMVITPAVVNGRRFWRVAAASYDRSSAQGVCLSVKARGGACFAYATSGPWQNLAMTRTEATARLAAR